MNVEPLSHPPVSVPLPILETIVLHELQKNTDIPSGLVKLQTSECVFETFINRTNICHVEPFLTFITARFRLKCV